MKKKHNIPAHTIHSIWRNPIHFIAFGFGSGVLPKMPGTYGTLVAIPLYMLIMNCSLWLYSLITLAVIVLSIIICEKAERDLGIHDHPGMVIDEIAGYFLTMLAVPVGWFWILAGFILFRIFDIWKPWPIRWLDQKMPGGFGTVVDDLLAAVYAWVGLQLMAGLYFYYD